ncbi:hypothetical protein ACFQ2J_11000 [Thalassobacillus hwangdonensis]|uniref:Uncharacterized protein n=2 Tax=Thalassobacillus hwangdonensis TaxID=546108 RepID=A0ABW3L2M0_9BACI
MLRWITGVLVGISLLGLFFPWFYFNADVDYSNGWRWMAAVPTVLIGIVAGFILLWQKRRSKKINLLTLAALLIIPLSCMYGFFTWHVPTVTGEISFQTSFEHTHFGFYLTMISSLLAVVLYLPTMKQIQQ